MDVLLNLDLHWCTVFPSMATKSIAIGNHRSMPSPQGMHLQSDHAQEGSSFPVPPVTSSSACWVSCNSQGSFKNTTPDVLLAEVLSAVLSRTGVDPGIVGEVSTS